MVKIALAAVPLYYQALAILVSAGFVYLDNETNQEYLAWVAQGERPLPAVPPWTNRQLFFFGVAA